MVFSLALTYSAIAFILLLMSVYFSKTILSSSRTKMFKVIMILTALFIITDIIPVLLANYSDWGSKGIIEIGQALPIKIAVKFHWVILILWWAVFFNYCFTMIKKIENKSVLGVLTYDLFSKISTIIFIVVLIVYSIVIPYNGLFQTITEDGIKNNIITYMPGNNYIILLAFCVVIFGLVFSKMYFGKYKGNATKEEKYAIIITSLVAFGTVILQAIVTYVSFVPLGLVLLVYSLYFNLENPDLAIMEEISSAQGDIEKSNQTKTDFLSNMTYEIKVPMNLISSLCDELVNMSEFDEKLVRDDIEQIQTSGNNLLDIINNILDISKIESGKDTLFEREYQINEILTNIVNIAKSKIGVKPVKLELNIDQNISSVLYGDSAKLYQALINIMGNAVKYTEVGKISLTLSSTKASGMEHLLFKISDTGSGIKEEDQDKLFSKFTRLDNAVENEIEGSGLGLVITKQYIETMGGKIWYETQYRVGTTFYIEVPQKIVDSTTLGASLAATKTINSDEKLDCSKFTALIVDDNNLNIKVAKRLLEAYKFNIESVTTGKDCVYKIKEGTHYDVIFMDHMMPEMDGIETLHVLKKLDGYDLPPIIALTANAIAGMKEMYLSEGFDDYLSKPINTNELDRVVNKFFRK